MERSKHVGVVAVEMQQGIKDRLKGKRALVTGGTSGIGLETARVLFINAGVADLRPPPLDSRRSR